MKESVLRKIIGLGLVLSNLIIVILLYYLHSLGGYSFPEVIETVEIIAPLFAAQNSVIIAYFVKYRYQSDSVKKDRVLDSGYVVLVLLFSAVVPLMIIVATILQSLPALFGSFAAYKKTIISLEVLFGAQLGVFVNSLFNKDEQSGTPGH